MQGGMKNQVAGTIWLLSSILRLNEGALTTVTDHVLGEDPSLQTVQTMFCAIKRNYCDTGCE
jgi:hypothetical protein